MENKASEERGLPLSRESTRRQPGAAITALVITSLSLVTACSASSPSEQSGRPTPATTGGQTSLVDVNAEERFSALLIRPTEPETIPVMGTDGRFHVVYELEVQNTSPRPATITEVLTLDPENDVVSSLEGDAVMALSMIVADFALPPVPADLVPAGRSVLLIMDAVFDQDNEIPSSLIHAVTATFGGFEPNQGDFALNNFPDESTETGGLVTVGDGEPEVIGPPMTGGGWVAVNGCCELSPHRGAMLPLGGRINGSERYAVDWSRFDTDAEPLVDFEMGTQATFSGDPDDNNSYFTFGEPAIAVADAEVIAVVDGLEDAPPHVFLTLPLKDLGGNRVILKLRDGVYAFYGHLKKGSVLVEVGDTVERGDQIAELGNSGNTSEAHLHFHLMNGPLPLTATNLPWVIDSFVFEGTAEPAGLIATGTGERENELPLMYSTVGFDD